MLAVTRVSALAKGAQRGMASSHTTASISSQDHTKKDATVQKDSLKAGADKAVEEAKKAHKTQAQLDQEVMEKLAGIAGDGGDAGLELEDGKPVSMKRSVKSNMFRYI
ncbi:hypothetical protein LTR62_005847 [Meristemomyces frigidus]|uniref:Uncharacterized protein n=1 Tax=Meristemomyces frigidus TaxID=1508187 RepID=A0AAN7YJ52_9PEZI|nr:hypothetical protein LTR62_005847 [Meristemomyces frigidus]